MNKLIIDRSKWRTGSLGKEPTGLGPSMLRNSEGFKCCLGFFCEQALGTEDIDMECGMPDLFLRHNPSSREKLSLLVHGKFNSEFANQAARINDSGNTRKVREDLLTDHFAEKGIEVVFEGQYVDYVD
jgi:hypothetical protein